MRSDKRGYTEKVQPTEGAPIATVGGFVLGANPYEFIDANALNTQDASNNPQADGDNPSISPEVDFANGVDKRIGR